MGKRAEAIIYGIVQGVYYRYYTRREAERLDLTGWVANQRDGTVKVVVEGPERALQEMVSFLLQGSPESTVDHVKVDWLKATSEFNEFSIRHI